MRFTCFCSNFTCI